MALLMYDTSRSQDPHARDAATLYTKEGVVMSSFQPDVYVLSQGQSLYKGVPQQVCPTMHRCHSRHPEHSQSQTLMAFDTDSNFCACFT